MTKFDPTKPVATRDGRPARILDTKFQMLGRPIVSVVTNAAWMGDVIQHHYQDGTLYGPACEISPGDLVNVLPPEKTVTVWANIYADGMHPAFHSTRHDAEDNALDYRVAMVQVTVRYREGDGLS